jgi:hypothetical protein
LVMSGGTCGFAYREVGKGREQDAVSLSGLLRQRESNGLKYDELA